MADHADIDHAGLPGVGGSVADIVDLPTAETDDGLVLAPDGAGGVEWVAPAASGVTVQDEGSPLSTAGTTLNFVGTGVAATGSGATKTITISSGGSSNVATPTVVQRAVVVTDATSLTIAAASSGNRIVAVATGNNASPSAMTCTNVTFTKVADVTAGGGVHTTVWVGVVSGTSGTTLSVTSGATFTNIGMVEVTDALTPTAGTVRSATRSSNDTSALLAGLTAGRFVAVAFGNDNAGNAVYALPTFPFVLGVLGRCNLHVAYAPTGSMTISYVNGSTGQAGGLVVVDIT